jgi:plasmid stabilization system protein ParE
VDYLIDQDPAIAHRYLLALEKALSLLRESPEAGPPAKSPEASRRKIRCWSIRGFTRWLVLYTFDEEVLLVVRLIHASRGIASIFS